MLPPLNLLALDTTACDADCRTWQGIQAADSGFRTTFSGLRQSPAPAEHALPELPEDISGMARLALAEGEPLPRPGKALPLQGAAVDRTEMAGSDPGIIVEDPGQLCPSRTHEPGETVAFVPPLELPDADLSPAAAAGWPDSVTARASVEAQSANSPEAAGRAGQATILNHIRYVPPDAGVRAPGGIIAAEPVVEAAPPADLLELRQKNPAAIRDAGLLQPLVQQVAEPIQAKVRAQTATEALLHVPAQDARPVLPSPTPPPFAAATTTAASSSSPQWVASQIYTTPGKPGWDEALGERVTWMAGNKLQNAELRLNPAELGPLRVQISIDDGNATVNFTAQHPLTRDAIEQALPRLREMLADQGLSLQHANVSEQGKGEGQSGPRRDADAPGLSSDRNGTAGKAPENAAPAARHAVGMVDLFA